MNMQLFTFDVKPNVGTVDRYLRLLLATSLIATPMVYEGAHPELVALLALAAIPVMFTVISQWCPVYGYFHTHSIATQNRSRKFHSSNVGPMDAMVRYLLGAVLIASTMLFAGIHTPWMVLPALVAIPLINSAILRWDPLYALFQLMADDEVAGLRSSTGPVIISLTPRRPTTTGGSLGKAA